MSTEFRNDNSVLFNQLGLTTALSGITLTQTMYNTSTGETTATSYAPTALNYVVGAGLTNIITGSSYQNIFGGVLSLTTAPSRAVEMSLVNVGGIGSCVAMGTPNIQNNNVIYFRIIRGPSTIVDGSIFAQQIICTGGTTANFNLTPSLFRWWDFSPLSGAATYVLQGATDGLSTRLFFTTTAFMVRQI